MDQVSEIEVSLTDKKNRLESLFLKQREIEVKKALNRAKLVLNNHFECIKKDTQEIDLGKIQRKITLVDSHFQILKGYQPNEDYSLTKSTLKKSSEKKLKRCSFSA